MTVSTSKPIAQNADIRYLGKLLGDVIRAYGGQELFQRIENIRASSVDRHRGIADEAALARVAKAIESEVPEVEEDYTDEEVAELERRRARYLSGESKPHSVEESMRRAREGSKR